MFTVSLEEVQARLPDIIKKLIPGEEVVITRNSRPVAKLMEKNRRHASPANLVALAGN